MNTDEEAIQILPDESLQILALFPTRTVQKVSLDLPSFIKLFDLLSCPICRQLLHHPVYLKCSHRFCKACIERYIRCSKKKSCPICRGVLTTRRDLRQDDNIQSLISLGFGDSEILEEQLNLIEGIEVKRLMGKDPVQAVQAEEVKYKKTRRQPQTENQEVASSTSGVKKMKTNRGEQFRMKSHETSPSVTTICVGIEKQQEELQKQLPEDKGNKQSIPTQDSNRVLQQDQSMKRKFMKCVDVRIIPQKQSKLITCNPPPLVVPSQENKKTKLKNIPIPSPNTVNPSPLTQKALALPVDLKKEPEPEPIVSAVEKAKITLRQQFGQQQYLYKLIEQSKNTIYIQISVRKHPHHIFTPELTFSTIQIPANYPLLKLAFLISKEINIAQEAIQLYVKTASSQNLQEVHKKLQVVHLAKDYWQIKSGFSLCELTDMIERMSVTNKLPSPQNQKAKLMNVVYFSVDHKKLVSR